LRSNPSTAPANICWRASCSTPAFRPIRRKRGTRPATCASFWAEGGMGLDRIARAQFLRLQFRTGTGAVQQVAPCNIANYAIRIVSQLQLGMRPDVPLQSLICSRQTGPLQVREFSVPNFLGWEERKTMKASKFSDAQKAFILKQGADGVPVADICRKAGISQATFTAARTWCARSIRPAPLSAIRGRSGSTSARNSCRRDLDPWGPTRTMWSWTSHDRASRRTMRSSRQQRSSGQR
jgi:hypothetical protein